MKYQKKQGSAKLLDSVNYFRDFTYFDSISGRYVRRFKLSKTDKYNEYGNLHEIYIYSFDHIIQSRRLGGIVSRDPEERVIQSTHFWGSCFWNIVNYTYDTDGNLIKIKDYFLNGVGCLDTTQNTSSISQYEYTYNNVGKKTSETCYNNRFGYLSEDSRIEYKYVNDSLLSLTYYCDNYLESEKRWLYYAKTQMVYDSTGLLQKEISFLNIAQATKDSIWYSNDTAKYYYTFNDNGQIESMQRFKLTGNIDRKYTYYLSGVIDSIVEKNVNYNITSKYDEDGYIKYKDQTSNLGNRIRERWEYHYVGDVVISGIDEKTENNRLVIYPNPAVQQITIALNPMETEHIVRKTEILNLSGQTVWTDNSSYLQKTIDLSALRPGTYFIRLTTSNGIISKKLFKM